SGAEIDPRLPKLSGKGPRKPSLLLAAQMGRSLSDPAVAQEGVQACPLLPERFQGWVELVFVLFHESETAPFEDHRPALRRHVEPAKGNDLADAALQVARQLLVGQEQDIGIVPVGPPALDVSKPGAIAHLAAQEQVEELAEGAFVAVVGAVQVVVR